MSRNADHPIAPWLLSRHSPRAMSGAPLRANEIDSLCEAARWAPSAGNLQPWRLLVLERDTPAFEALFATLAGGNQVWCTRAAVLFAWVSLSHDAKGRTLPSAAFDTGAAWMSLALQGQELGLVVHTMAGYDPAQARTVLGLPDDVVLHALTAVGRPGNTIDLPTDLQTREVPNGRFPITASVARDRWHDGLRERG